MFRTGRNSKEDQVKGESESPDQAPRSVSSSANASTEAKYPSVKPSGAGAAPRAVSESEALARDIKEGSLSGFVGAGTSMTGEANFKAMLRIDGHLSGHISSETGTLIVSAGGQVDADIAVAVALINGTVTGDVVASKRLELGRAARLTGNIEAPALIIEQGAVFDGTCRMPQPKAAPEERMREESNSTDNASSFIGGEENHPEQVSEFSDVAS